MTDSQKLSSSIHNSIERQMVQAASAGKLSIMRNKGELEPYVVVLLSRQILTEPLLVEVEALLSTAN